MSETGINSIQGLFYSINWGQGRTVALVSYRRHGLDKTRRLLIDQERRARQYRSPDGEDHPEQLKWAFDYFHQAYAEALDDGELTVRALVTLYNQIRRDEFSYDALLVDNAAMFQDDIRLLLVEDPSNAKAKAETLAKAFRGVYANNHAFIQWRFKVTDNTGIYMLVKSVISELLRMCQRKGVDVLVATEARNVWKDYGTKTMRVLGQTAKLLDPWFKYADFAYQLSRTTGSRDDGTAKLVAIPQATFDTFNPKSSLPGLPPIMQQFTWDNFWAHVLSRQVSTQKQLDQIKVEKSEAPDYAVEQQPEQPHWIDKTTREGDDVRDRFWAWAKKQGLSEERVYAELGVTDMHEYAGTMEEAFATLRDLNSSTQDTHWALDQDSWDQFVAWSREQPRISLDDSLDQLMGYEDRQAIADEGLDLEAAQRIVADTAQRRSATPPDQDIPF